MQQIQGVVENTNVRPYGNREMFNMKVGGEWYGMGTLSPDRRPNIGDTVSFTAIQKGNFWNGDAKTVQVVSGGTPAQQPQAASPAAAPSRQQAQASKDSYWTDKAEADKLREVGMAVAGARNSAIELVSVALANGCVDLPAKKADKLQALKFLVEDITTELYLQTEAAKKDGGLFLEEVGNPVEEPKFD